MRTIPASSEQVYSQNADLKPAKEISLIHQVTESLDNAWNKRSSEEFSKLFLEDADFQYWDGVLLKNRNEIEQYYGTKVFKALPPDFRHSSAFQRIRFLRSYVAVGDGRL